MHAEAAPRVEEAAAAARARVEEAEDKRDECHHLGGDEPAPMQSMPAPVQRAARRPTEKTTPKVESAPRQARKP